jgi:hypothetical protein
MAQQQMVCVGRASQRGRKSSLSAMRRDPIKSLDLPALLRRALFDPALLSRMPVKFDPMRSLPVVNGWPAQEPYRTGHRRTGETARESAQSADAAFSEAASPDIVVFEAAG